MSYRRDMSWNWTSYHRWMYVVLTRISTNTWRGARALREVKKTNSSLFRACLFSFFSGAFRPFEKPKRSRDSKDIVSF